MTESTGERKEPTTGPSGPAALSPRHRDALQRFITLWGEMASSWGINRTMAQIHALLYAVETPLDTDEIMAWLDISRGNANMNLRSLINWNLATKVNQPGSRKDYYTAQKDVWEITAQIIRERERREIKPVIEQLEDCRTILITPGEAPSEPEALFQTRIANLQELMEVFEGFSKAFLPFVRQRNRPLLRQLINTAAAFHEAPEDQP